MSPDGVTSVRELDERVSGRTQVRLLWSADENRVWVTVLDIQSGEGFRLDVAHHESAHDVFHHPFAYSAVRSPVPMTASEDSRAAGATR